MILHCISTPGGGQRPCIVLSSSCSFLCIRASVYGIVFVRIKLQIMYPPAKVHIAIEPPRPIDPNQIYEDRPPGCPKHWTLCTHIWAVMPTRMISSAGPVHLAVSGNEMMRRRYIDSTKNLRIQLKGTCISPPLCRSTLLIT